MNGENGAFPPTRDGSIHPLLSRKSAWKRLKNGAYPFNNAEIAENARKKRSIAVHFRLYSTKKCGKKILPIAVLFKSCIFADVNGDLYKRRFIS